MAPTEKLKQSLYFADDTLREIMREANRLDRSLSWTVQQAWRIAREQVRSFPAAHLQREPLRARTAAPSREQPAPAAPREASGPRDLESIRASDQVLEFLRGKFDRELH